MDWTRTLFALAPGRFAKKTGPQNAWARCLILMQLCFQRCYHFSAVLLGLGKVHHCDGLIKLMPLLVAQVFASAFQPGMQCQRVHVRTFQQERQFLQTLKQMLLVIGVGQCHMARDGLIGLNLMLQHFLDSAAGLWQRSLHVGQQLLNLKLPIGDIEGTLGAGQYGGELGGTNGSGRALESMQ